MKINGMKLLCCLILITPMCKGVIESVMFFLIAAVSSFIMLQYMQHRNARIIFIKGDISVILPLVSVLGVAYAAFTMLLNGMEITSFIRVLQLYIAMVVLFLFSEWKIQYEDYLFIVNLMQCIIAISFLLWLLSGFETNYFSALFTHSNLLSSAMLCYLAIFLCVKNLDLRYRKITYMMMVILFFVANSRASILALVVFLLLRGIFIHWESLKKTWIFFITIIMGTVFPYIYLYLYNSDLRSILNNISVEYFRKNFFSGRQILWEPVLEAISEKILFGYGLQMTPESLISTSYSAHNWYLQTLLQIGVIGYFILVFILWIVWKKCMKTSNVYISATGCAFMISILTLQCFEVTLTQNNFSVGMLTWVIFGILTNRGI